MKLRGVPGAGKVHLKCSNKKLVKDDFASRRHIRFDMFMWCQVWQINQNILDEKRVIQFNVR